MRVTVGYFSTTYIKANKKHHFTCLDTAIERPGST